LGVLRGKDIIIAIFDHKNSFFSGVKFYNFWSSKTLDPDTGCGTGSVFEPGSALKPMRMVVRAHGFDVLYRVS
jgi:hypothetical protein